MDSGVALKLRFDEPADTTVLHLSSLLYDMNLLNDCIVLVSLPEYAEFKFSTTFWYRNGRPVSRDHRLYLGRIRHSSPIELSVIFTMTAAAVGVPWVLVQTIEKVSNWKLNRQKLKYDVEKARLEVEKLAADRELQTIQLAKAEAELEVALRQREAMDILHRIVGNIEQNELTAVEADVFVMKRESDLTRKSRG